jgi:hypothetical protein
MASYYDKFILFHQFKKIIFHYRQRGVYKKDLESVGKAFHHLGQSLEGEVDCLAKVSHLMSRHSII